jgi:phytoene/squalene synthetase
MLQINDAPEASHRFVLDSVRETDRDRFLAALFAPEPARRGLLALLAFDLELARTRAVTSEPLLGRIRLQWWREAVAEAAGTGRLRAQPLAESLSETVRRHRLDPALLEAMLAAREDELEGPLDPSRTADPLADLGLAVLGVGDDASRRAARAVARARLVPAGEPRRALLVAARAEKPDRRAWPMLLPALALGDGVQEPGVAAAWRPVAYWWAWRRGRY